MSAPSRSDSVGRAKRKIFDIALLNEWDYFVTLTLDQKEIDRTNAEEVAKKFRKWLNNMVTRKDLKYIFVFEHHKDKKGIHMHGLVKCDKLNLSPSVSAKTGRPMYTKSGQRIYDLKDWKYGFTQCIDLYGEPIHVAKYITKYITKDTEKIAGNFYYAGGHDLQREPIVYVGNFENPQNIIPMYFDNQKNDLETKFLMELALKQNAERLEKYRKEIFKKR